MKKDKYKFSLLTIVIGLSLLISQNIYGQQVENIREIKGSVTGDDLNSPLPGATVLLGGSKIGAVTDYEGNFTLKISGDDPVLKVSFIGYKTQEVKVGNRAVINVNLELDAAALEEVVVIGYGSVKKSDATGSLALVSSDKFNKGAVNSPAELIVGKVAGVTVTPISGAPGNSSTIRIRGGASLSASNDPLIVIDNVPIDNAPTGGAPNILSTLNPNDIASFTVLKDASATAIYGSRASNGVILITTKRGAKGFKVDYSFTGSFYTVPKKLDVYTGDEFRTLINEQYSEQSNITALLGDDNTDWQDEIYQNSFGQDHNISVSGASDHLKYRVSLGYNNTDGVLKTYNFERTTLAVGLDPSFFGGKLKGQINLKGMLNKNNFAEQGAIGNAISYDPTQSVFNDNTRYRGYNTWTLENSGINGDAINLAPANPVAQLALTDNTSQVLRSIGNMKWDYQLIDGLTASINLGYDYMDSDGHNNALDSTQWTNNPTVNGGRYNTYVETRQNELLDAYLSYNKGLESIDSKIDVMGGYSWAHFKKGSESQTYNYAKTDSLSPQDNPTEYYLLSYFGRLNYTLKDRYLLTLSLRSDGTSRFSSDNRWGMFPAAAFAWHASKESFLTNSEVVSDLKLRLGYGQTGQQDVNSGDYPYLATYTVSDNASRYALGANYYNTLRPDGYDANIQWETTKTFNAGIDFGFVKNRLTGSLDVYHKETEDMISTVDVPVGTNFTASLLTNVGSMVNKGVEFNLDWIAIETDDLQWTLNANVFYNQNEITKLNLTDDPDYSVLVGNIGNTTDGTIQVHRVGSPANSFLVYEQVYNTDGTPVYGAYVDRNDDGIINDEDLYVHHNPSPEFSFGFNSWLSYKKFDLSINARANVNNYVYNNVQSRNNYNSLHDSMGFLRNMAKSDFPIDSRHSDHFIENASFFRIDNINLAYNFDEVFNGLGNIQVSVGVQNAFVWTSYSGLDPEISGGLDNNFYPRTRTFIAGLRASF
ncbi:MAG: TonB-dependent receptor [Reichenbachiella sp.]